MLKPNQYFLKETHEVSQYLFFLLTVLGAGVCRRLLHCCAVALRTSVAVAGSLLCSAVAPFLATLLVIGGGCSFFSVLLGFCALFWVRLFCNKKSAIRKPCYTRSAIPAPWCLFPSAHSGIATTRCFTDHQHAPVQ